LRPGINQRVGETLSYTIESASLRDLADLRRLERECFFRDAWPLLDLIGVLTFPGIVRLKAVIEGGMVGFVAGDAKILQQVGWITTIGVAGTCRRNGIGYALLGACELGMRMPEVRLCVRKSNLVAQRMYEKAGYQPAGIWERYYEGGEDALVLQKNLLRFNSC
jgi:ribosomal protein S18 acetylase RimI-like enzyme